VTGLPPTFLLIGAGKSGTTSLFRYLCQHPDVYDTPIKEPRFFAVEGRMTPELARVPRLVSTWDGYLALYDGARPDQARGEASMCYLHSEGVVDGVRARIPDARLLVILRHPAEAVWSHYQMSRRKGRTRSLGRMIDQEPLEPRVTRFTNTDTQMVRMRFYHHHLTRWLDAFSPEQLQVLLYDDLEDDPAALVQQAWAHIGVDPTVPVDVAERHNVGTTPRSARLQAFRRSQGRLGRAVKAPLRHAPGGDAIRSAVTRWNRRPTDTLPADLRRRLLDIYRDDTEALEELLGRDLSTWRR
jgi:hypothetical protein